ncbi:hypothetical protein ASE17_20295 [Phenylobacterium sp. Root77]|uniref:hypothetical protein n=1 Tax=unclassified Phenylobacterium TaxID=2640670 RepID=UPI0006F8A03E|nr:MULTISPECIES: hypothetical protein [unclassified Phenylobacterium]KQW67080.1 hypothetical protein ASC73_18310 [Phenylobacterium sp. Root1277]KQW89773.1 hypothetical protein ASC79_19215 [Phenylobacterium sp. Root1290]KRC43610.1 hypothetical protein ASE17_20295 [Phenylobacterium sp. Root77]
MANENQSPGRKANAAEPLARRSGLLSDKAVERTGLKSRKAAGPDGRDAAVVGATFKKKPQ